jgi:nitrate/TMAO reductase-like tetraheme cytochrome c subunit
MALYSGGVIVASTSHACTSCSMMRETRASILKAVPSSSRATAAIAACSSCSISFIHSSLVWCWMMNSISLWSGDSGFCAPRMASSCR